MSVHQRTTSLLLQSGLALCLALLSGCSLLGGESDLIRADTYKVDALPGWKSRDAKDSDRAYVLPSKNVVTVTSSCQRDTEASLELLTRHLLIGGRNVDFVEKRPMTVDNANGLFSRVRATYDGVRAYLLLFVVTKADCVFDFSLVSHKLIPDSDVDDFLSFVKTFRYGKN